MAPTFLPDDDARLDPGSDFGRPDANGWMPIETHVGTDDEEQPWVFIWDAFNKKRWIAEWDGSCGYFQGICCLDNIYTDGDRLYGATHWMPFPVPPVQP